MAGVHREEVASVEAAAGLVRRAAAARAVEATAMNEQSSRSHTVFVLYITATHAAAGTVLRGALNLVDLAGSERLSRRCESHQCVCRTTNWMAIGSLRLLRSYPTSSIQNIWRRCATNI